MKYSEWNVRDLDGCCIFSISNYNEDELFDYLYTIQQYILQLELGDYSVLSFSIIEYHDSELKDLDIITDFPYSYFSLFNPDWTGAIEIIL
jgi:hypothetical protein